MSQDIDKNYYTSSRVPIGAFGSEEKPRTQICGLVLNHQLLKDLELKKLSNIDIFDQMYSLLRGF